MQESAQIVELSLVRSNDHEGASRFIEKSRHFCASRLRWFLLFSLFLCFVSLALSASPIDLDARDNALGSASSFGHARIVRPLGELPIGGVTFPVNLVFNTNPVDAPGAFGPYWRIPLLATTVVQFNQYKLYWDGLDERRQFFVLDQSYEARRGEKVFVERGKDWKATVTRSGEILIEALDEQDWYFRYDDGLLKEFKLGASADLCMLLTRGAVCLFI